MRLILAVALLFAWASVPSHISAQDHNQQGANVEPKPKTEKRITKHEPIVVKILPPTKTEAETQKEEEGRSERNRTEELKKKTDADLVKFTSQLADYTWLLFIVGSLQAAIFVAQMIFIWRQEKATRTIERAYVQMSHELPGLVIKEDGLMCYVEVRVKTFGRTPARVSDELLNFIVLNKDERLPKRPDYKKLPGHEAPKGFLLTGDELFAKEMSEIDLSRVKSGEKVLWLFGYVDYIDQFNGRHRAGYARVYIPDADLANYHGDREGSNKRNNLAYVTQDRYNYDERRKHGEGNDWGKEFPS